MTVTHSATAAPGIGFAETLQELKSGWGWFVGIGAILAVLGIVAIGAAALTTLASMLFFGWLLVIGGIAEAVHAFWQKRWSGLFLELFTGLLYLVVGFLIVANPAATAVALTLLIAMFLLVQGIVRAVSAIAQRYPQWGWVLVHGIISVLLGIAIWQGWPLSGLWAIGLFIGIDMLLTGTVLVMLGLRFRRLPSDGAAAPA